MSEPQNLKNHGRLDPLYHLFLAGIVIATVIIAIVGVVRKPDFLNIWFVVLSVAAFFLLLRMRQYPLKVQDRVIRLEERLRLQALAPQELHVQLGKLTEDQLIGLRFASNEEVVALAQQALAENLNRKQIKERIQNWRPDDWRI